jgi:hypothetical protein
LKPYVGEDVKDEDDIVSEDVDFAVGNTLKWLRSEEKDRETRRRAEEQAEEDKREGDRRLSSCICYRCRWYPFGVVETERRLAAAAADAHNGKDNTKTQR